MKKFKLTKTVLLITIILYLVNAVLIMPFMYYKGECSTFSLWAPPTDQPCSLFSYILFNFFSGSLAIFLVYFAFPLFIGFCCTLAVDIIRLFKK